MRLFLHELRASSASSGGTARRRSSPSSSRSPLSCSARSTATSRSTAFEPAPVPPLGLIGYGVAATAFAGLAITLVIRRESGCSSASAHAAARRRLYLRGIGSTVVVFCLEVVALIVLGRLAFDVALPDNAASLVSALAVGAAAFAALGSR